MNKLFNAMNTKSHFTANGAVTHGTSGKKLLDLFFTIGSMRTMSTKDKEKMFISSYQENPEMTIKALFYARDCRGGMGERETFRILYKVLYAVNRKLFLENLYLIPVYGRWDDLFYFVDKINDKEFLYKVIDLIKTNIIDNNSRLLVGKWLPRESSKNKHIARILAKHLDINMKEYRYLCTMNSETVEQLICKKQWDKIDYSHVPSLAMLKYTKSFYSKDELRFKNYIELVKKGTAKINASTLNPCDILCKLLSDKTANSDVYEELWKNLPNYLNDDKGSNILVMADVSGSMYRGSSKSAVQPIHVSISLALYLSERMKGSFKNYFLTFSDNPELVEVVGTTFVDRVKYLSTANWMNSTNLRKAFMVILKKAIENQVPAEDMPEYILIISDMEFNCCRSITNYESIVEEYSNRGYKVPKIVFWNVNGRMNNVPIKEYDKNTALVSGYSPSLIKPILNIEDFTPLNVVLQILNQERYNQITTK